MTSGPSLSQFRDEMRRLAAIIGMPENYLASCGEPARGGHDVALSADGTRYVLTYSEKGDVDLIIESPDADTVMEQFFVLATANWAPTLVDGDGPIDPEDVLGLLPSSTDELRAMASGHHAKTGRVQEDLLGQLNPAWRERQASKNAHRAQSIRDLFDR